MQEKNINCISNVDKGGQYVSRKMCAQKCYQVEWIVAISAYLQCHFETFDNVYIVTGDDAV